MKTCCKCVLKREQVGEVSFLLQRFLVVHVFHLPSYMHYIPAVLLKERKKKKDKSQLSVKHAVSFLWRFLPVAYTVGEVVVDGKIKKIS